jgi:hypothetical protein
VRSIFLKTSLAIGVPLLLSGYKEGPGPNVAGGFGDRSCHSCHLDNPLNAPGGSLVFSGIAGSYEPGRSYPITIRLVREGMERGGFQIVARFAAGPQKGKQAGSWRLMDGRARMIAAASDPALQFVEHTAAGTTVAMPGVQTWTVEWTAAVGSSDPVQFNVAANASNDDASALGDFIYLQERVYSVAK